MSSSAKNLEFLHFDPEDENLNERKERILKVFEAMREKTGDELLAFWHKLMAEEAELIHELRNENQILQSIMGSSGLVFATDDDDTDDPATVVDDSTDR